MRWLHWNAGSSHLQGRRLEMLPRQTSTPGDGWLEASTHNVRFGSLADILRCRADPLQHFQSPACKRSTNGQFREAFLNTGNFCFDNRPDVVAKTLRVAFGNSARLLQCADK